MSQEQLTPPSFEQSPASRATPFEDNNEIHLRMSNLAPIQEARAAIAAAINSAEVVDSEEVQRLKKIRLVESNGDTVENNRAAHQQDHFDLTSDDTPAQTPDNDTQDMFEEAA